jgi:hypothetical protein
MGPIGFPPLRFFVGCGVALLVGGSLLGALVAWLVMR